MFSGLWFLCPRVIVVDEHFKDVTKDFNQCPDVLVHSVAFFCLAMQSYGFLFFTLCFHVFCHAIVINMGFFDTKVCRFVPFFALFIKIMCG